ncbi:MAG: hypothetical protein ACI89X_003557 [Planctomycetota bacterium]|jgi:hypothetical protein
MDTRAILALCLLTTSLALPAQTEIGFAVAGPNGMSGFPCDPVTCTPATVDADSGDTLALRLKGARYQPHLLLLSIAPAPCVPVPGFAGALLVQPPGVIFIMDLSWYNVFVTGPGPTCGGWIGMQLVPVPALPMNMVIYLQTLAPINGQLTFSNAVEVTIN